MDMTLLICLCMVITTDAVKIAPPKTPVIASDTQTFVVLSSNFTTEDCPQITWYRHTDGERNLVVQRNMEGKHKVSRQYRDRVGFGNRGNLILINPEVDDSGHYSCEVEVDYENPVWAKVEMDLKVLQEKQQSTATTRMTPLPCAQSRNSMTASEFLIFLNWFLPVASTFILSGGLRSFCKNSSLNEQKQIQQSQSRKCAIIGVCIHCLAMLFALISTFCLLKTTTNNIMEYDTVYTAGEALGIIGNTALVVLMILCCLRRKIFRCLMRGKEEKVKDNGNDMAGKIGCPSIPLVCGGENNEIPSNKSQEMEKACQSQITSKSERL